MRRKRIARAVGGRPAGLSAAFVCVHPFASKGMKFAAAARVFRGHAPTILLSPSLRAMTRKALSIAVISISFLAAGCAGIGPGRLKADQVDYARALGDAKKREILA